MKANRWLKVKEIFQAALERAPHERAAFVSDACGDDAELRQEVESLISSDGRPGGFLETPAYAAAAETIVNGVTELKPKQMAGPYEVVSFISRGGMGEVYLAQDKRLNRKVALKLLPAAFTKNDERLRRFEQEARSASALNHPNIITIYEILESGKNHIIATEFVEGETLRQRLTQSQFTLNESLNIAIQVADALAAAHKVGIIHRDIKPENIMVRPDGYVKILDFGLAKLAEMSGAISPDEAVTKQVRTGSGVVMGTAGYMSPEQARGKEVDTRSDVFSLGAVIYEMVSATKPFDGETPSDTLAAILKTEPLSLSELRPDAPAELVRIVHKSLRKDREERYQVIKDLLIDLRSLKQDLEFQEKLGNVRSSGTVRSTRVAAAVGAPQTGEVRNAISTLSDSLTIEIRRHRFAAITAFVIVALLIGGGGYWLYKYLRQKPVHFQATTLTRLTNSGKVIDATLTPDGRYVVFVLSDARRQSIWIRQVSTANEKVIVEPEDVGVFGITVSPDGNELYYVIKKNLDRGTLYRVPVLGGTPTKIIEWLDAPVTFSPDGKRIAFLRGSFPGEGESALLVVNADGTGEQKVIARRKRPEAFVPIFFGGPSWAPEDDLVVSAVSNVTKPSHLIAFNVDSGKETDLTPKGMPFIARAQWLPDMSGLLMIAGISPAETQVWFLSYPDLNVRQVTNDLSQHRDIGLSSAADKFVTVLTTALVNVYVVPNGEAQKAMQLPVGNLGFYGSYGNTVGWTPDGRIVFASTESSSIDLWIMNADGSERKQITNDKAKNIGPVVSQDGRYVVFTSNRSGVPAIWRIDINGSNPVQLSHGQGESQPAISPDGQWVFYTSLGTAKPTVWKVSINGGTPVELNSKVGLNPTVSPDGKSIAYIYPDSYDPFAPPNRIAIVPFEGGEPKILSFKEGSRTQTLTQWAVDSKSIYFSTTNNNVTNIWNQPLDGSPAKQVTDFKDGLMTGFAWSPDGKNLVCTRGTQMRDAVLISESK